MLKRVFLVYGALLGAMCLNVGATPRPHAVILYGSESGQPTLDEDAQGGNPFATALLVTLARSTGTFASFCEELIARTVQYSDGVQRAEVVGAAGLRRWRFLPKPSGQRWLALVVVFSDYSQRPHLASLPGARHDRRRIADALTRAGFTVTSVDAPGRHALERALTQFAAASAEADVAAIYATGHGTEDGGDARLFLPYPQNTGADTLTVHDLAAVARAKTANLVFYGACRTPRRSTLSSFEEHLRGPFLARRDSITVMQHR